MGKKIYKYWSVLKIGWLSSLMYRAELIMWTFVDLMPVVPMILIWVSVYHGGHQLMQFTLNELLIYYIFGTILNRFISFHFEDDAVREINSGSISRHFLKPYSLKITLVVSEIAWKILNVVILLLPMIVIVMMLFPSLRPTLLWSEIPLFIYTILAGFCIDFLLSLIIVALAFLTDQGHALSHVKWMLMGILGGSLLPISAYPTWLQTLSRISPFQFQFAVPMEILTHTPTLSTTTIIALSFFWLVILVGSVQLTWKLFMNKYTAVSG